MTSINKWTGDDSVNRYDEEQQRLWQQLHSLLEQLKAELEATHVELAQGLQISRQPLVSFMQAPHQRSLPIHRVNLVKLWDFLTNPALVEQKKISENAKQKRLQFRQQGADRLLEAAGFLPMSQHNRSSREHQIQRIASMLASLPDVGFANFNALINDLEAVVRSRAFPYINSVTGNQDESLISALSIKERIQSLFSEPLRSEILQPIIFNQIKKFLTVASTSGHFELTNAELFELSLCTLNYDKLSKTFDRYIKIQVQEYQFTVLTFSLHHYLLDDDLLDDGAKIRAELKEAEFKVESTLLQTVLQTNDGLEDSLTDIDSTERPSLVEAQINCNFVDIGEDICWRYRSSATHLENMLTAITVGLGCSKRLKLIESSTRTLGQKGYGLVKASAAFCDVDQTDSIYESVWVDRSAIKAFLQSSLTAATKWLADELSDTDEYANYYKVCHAVAQIETALTHGRKLLSDYAFQHISDIGISGTSSTKLHLGKQVIDKVQELKQNILAHSPVLQELYGEYLERQYCLANLTRARSAHVVGKLMQARNFLDDVQVSLRQHHNMQQCLEIKLLYAVERALHQFFSGDRAFIASKAWRSSLPSWSSDLNQYIAQENLKHGKYRGRFDFNTYLCASEIYGRIARLNLCFCAAEEIDVVEKSIQLSMQAAYCSSRIGYRQRAAHWLVNASRLHSRLGDQFNKAEALCNIAMRIIRGSLEPTYSDQYVESIMSEVNLARGERLLLVEKDLPAAVNHFLKSLRGGIYTGFARLIADGLYGIARASKELDYYQVRQSFKQVFNLSATKSNLFILDEQRLDWHQSNTVSQVIEFLSALDKTQNWSAVSDCFNDQAKLIWQQWYEEAHPQQSGTHPVADQIDSGTYLSRLL